ncbi:unnamed protein product [Rotaria sp. Silwood2]|nr:unnamed protein product [Rotaria sp. Silwood2]CAF2901575.1 unnamed protein product [Rotaria sp. Silwood2]CAF3097389.1 unnamed protein product [Rotaria sp. Silwood2]CAF3249639.1 unnamed protein product [Rotaria sp. Silwood2]CAF4386931.1 unnamed protein product [Rotaria sp. Silwood2]
MSESILSHILLYERLSWDLLLSQDKIRVLGVTDQSRFLSSLALVLNGSTTCTAIYVDLSDKVVFIARNEPIIINDERYFDRFFRQIRTYATLASLCSIKDKAIKEAKDQLDSLVCEYNSKKMMNYFIGRNSTVIDGLRKMVKWNTDEKCPFVEELRSNKESYTDDPLMTEKVYLIFKNYTEEDYMDFLLKKVDEFLTARDELFQNQVNPSEHQLMLAARLAMILYQSRLFRFILNHSRGTADKGVYYFEKTSAHIRAKNLLLKCLFNNKERFGQIYKNISWKLVPPIQQTHQLNITPRQAFENIFNNLLHSSNEIISNILQKTTSDSFYNQYLVKLKIIDEKPVYVGYVHAEILLIDYILNNNIKEADYLNQVEIGISKMPCLPCCYYIAALNKKHRRCFYQSDATHGKLYGKWIYRLNEDPSIINEINDKLIEKLQYLIQKILVESGRDGRPKKSGDSDIMFTSMEGDEIEEQEYHEVDP